MIRRFVPRSLFARTAVLIAATLTIFVGFAWIASGWAVIVPAARATGHQLSLRVRQSMQADLHQSPLPEGASFVATNSEPHEAAFAGIGFAYYLATVRRSIQDEIPGSRVVVVRSAGPSEIWVQTAELPGRWLRLTWDITRPDAPLAAVLVWLAVALLALAAAGISARRLARPLAALAIAADRVAQGERIAVDTTSGPSEVRSLAGAFQSMSQRLAELEGQRELMLAGVSHDLRSPLARMRVAVELMDERDSALAGEMTRDIEEMDRLIGQFLRYARSNYREAATSAIPDDIVRAALAGHQDDTRLVMELNAGAAHGFPANSFHHIVTNLVQNALDYGQAPVVVRTSMDESEIHLSVEDRGSGLSAVEWQQALRPFERLSITPNSGHSGLGLAMVDRLVTACRGRLSSRQSETGFDVQVFLPWIALDSTEGTLPPASKPSAGNSVS